jgi:hypothetical protein
MAPERHAAPTSPAKNSGRTSKPPKTPRTTIGYASEATRGSSGPNVPRPSDGLGEGPEPVIVQRIKGFSTKLQVAGLVPLGHVAVAKGRQPDHVQHERHTDCASGPNRGEPLALRLECVCCDFADRRAARASLSGWPAAVSHHRRRRKAPTSSRPE